jgi:signal transduction histidine kinase
MLSIAYSLNAQKTTPIFTTRWFTTENGLPANGIKGIQWDPETELVWIATEAGVARFNGTEFTLFTRNNTPILASERINFIVKDYDQKIFLAENKGNVIRVLQNKLAPFHIVKTESVENNKALYGLTISESYFKHLLSTTIEREFTLPFDKIAPYDQHSALILQKSKLYLSDTRSKNLKTIDIQEIKGKSLFKIDEFIYLIDSSNTIHLLNNTPSIIGKVNIKLEGLAVNDHLPKQAQIIWENGQSHPIAIIENQAWKLVVNKNSIKGIKICDQVPTDALIKYFLYVEEKGLIIIGTDSKGIAVFQQNIAMPIRANYLSNLITNSYYAQLELSDGSILTSQGHRLGNFTNKPFDLPIKKSFGNSIYLTADSFLWYQQYNPEKNIGGMFSYNIKTKERILKHTVKEGNSFAVWKQKDTTLIFSAEEIIQLEPTNKTIVKYSSNPATKSEPITSLIIDQNRIALATCSGLIFYNKKNNTTDTILSLPNYCVRSLALHRDYLLIGTYGDGIYIHKLNQETKKIPIDKKQSARYAHCFVLDNFGFAWISTNRGLLKAKVNDLIAAYDNPHQEIYYHYYGIADGMITSEMNGGCHPCALQLKNGYISFPTMDGLLWVDPKKVTTDTQKGTLFIDEIRVNDKVIESPSEILYNLPFSTKQISIKLSYAAWSNRENIYIYYRTRSNDPWKAVSYNNPSLIEINNIEPGEYELQIRKLNGFGDNNISLLSLPFHIKTPWYNKWWFYGFCALALYGMIMLYLSIRTRQLQISERKLKALVEEKTLELTTQNQTLEKNNLITSRLISIISHDIVTPLKFIQVAGKNLLSKKEKLSEDLRQETLTEITNTAQELQNLSTNILNWIRFQRKNRLLQRVDFSPYDVAEQVLRILGPFAKIKNLILQNNIDPTLIIHQYAEPFRILLHNLLSNAINFSEKGVISVTLTKQGGILQLKVTDQGVGMTPDQIENILKEDLIISSATVDNRKGHGLGYQIIKDLTGLIDANLEIESQKGKGTSVTINFNTTA